MSATMAGGDMSGGSEAGMVRIPQYILEDSPILAKKLKDFQEAEERAKKATELIGTAEEIEALRDQAAVERDAADEASVETKEVCAKLVSDALAEAEDIVEEARSKAEGMVSSTETKLERAEVVAENADTMMRDAQESARIHVSVKDALDRKEEALDARKASLEKQEQQLLKEKSKFAMVGEQIKLLME